jgi:hypothetical protein
LEGDADVSQQSFGNVEFGLEAVMQQREEPFLGTSPPYRPDRPRAALDRSVYYFSAATQNRTFCSLHSFFSAGTKAVPEKSGGSFVASFLRGSSALLYLK